ncbi:MAG: transposase [Spirochaetota bacterium]
MTVYTKFVTGSLNVFSILQNHRRKMRTSNLAERQMKEINRRTKVVEEFPNTDSLLRLAASMLIEQNDQWQSEKCYLPESDDRPASIEIYRKRIA